MASLVLPLEAVPPALRSPCRAALLAKQESATAAGAAAAGRGRSAGAEADNPNNGVACQGETHEKGAEGHPGPKGAVISQREGDVLKPVDRELGQRVVGAVRDAQFPGLLMRTPNGSVLVCRSALARSSLSTTRSQLQQLLLPHSQAAGASLASGGAPSISEQTDSSRAGSAPGSLRVRAADPEALQKILGSLETISNGGAGGASAQGPERSSANGGSRGSINEGEDVEAALEVMPGLRQAL
ncbi:hypothetical protein DUNSADRAFT_7481, partial [Dunaliella salina]